MDDNMVPVFKAGSVILASQFLVREPEWGVMVEFEESFLCRSEEVPAYLPWDQPQGCLQLNFKRCSCAAWPLVTRQHLFRVGEIHFGVMF